MPLTKKVLPSGSIVKIDGIPFRTCAPVVLEGAEGNFGAVKDSLDVPIHFTEPED